MVNGQEVPAQITPDALAEGWVEPVRATFDDADPKGVEDPVVKAGFTIVDANPKKEDCDKDPLTRRITAEVPIVIRYKVEDFLIFYQTIGSIKEAKRQLFDMAIAETIPALEVGTVARAQTNRAVISEYVTKRLADSTANWGIAIQPVRIKPFIFGRDLNVALQTIPEANAKAQSTMLAASAKKFQLEKEGEGAAAAIAARLQAEANGYKQIATATGADGQAVLAAQTMQTALEKAQYTLVAGSNGLS